VGPVRSGRGAGRAPGTGHVPPLGIVPVVCGPAEKRPAGKILGPAPQCGLETGHGPKCSSSMDRNPTASRDNMLCDSRPGPAEPVRKPSQPYRNTYASRPFRRFFDISEKQALITTLAAPQRLWLPRGEIPWWMQGPCFQNRPRRDPCRGCPPGGNPGRPPATEDESQSKEWSNEFSVSVGPFLVPSLGGPRKELEGTGEHNTGAPARDHRKLPRKRSSGLPANRGRRRAWHNNREWNRAKPRFKRNAWIPANNDRGGITRQTPGYRCWAKGQVGLPFFFGSRKVPQSGTRIDAAKIEASAGIQTANRPFRALAIGPFRRRSHRGRRLPKLGTGTGGGRRAGATNPSSAASGRPLF